MQMNCQASMPKPEHPTHSMTAQLSGSVKMLMQRERLRSGKENCLSWGLAMLNKQVCNLCPKLTNCVHYTEHCHSPMPSQTALVRSPITADVLAELKCSPHCVRCVHDVFYTLLEATMQTVADMHAGK